MKKLFRMTKTIINSITIAIPVTVAFTDSIAYVAKVDGVSMRPTLNDETTGGDKNQSNDFVLLSHWKVRDYHITRGQIVALISPRDPKQKIIKRVIGIEGDTIVTRNYKYKTVKVPHGHCWVEGDYHSKSMDSNFFGPVAVGLITSSAVCIVWPPKRWQWLSIAVPEDRKVIVTNRQCIVTIDTNDCSDENNGDMSIGDETFIEFTDL